MDLAYQYVGKIRRFRSGWQPSLNSRRRACPATACVEEGRAAMAAKYWRSPEADPAVLRVTASRLPSPGTVAAGPGAAGQACRGLMKQETADAGPLATTVLARGPIEPVMMMTPDRPLIVVTWAAAGPRIACPSPCP